MSTISTVRARLRGASILCFGDSLTTGFGQRSYPTHLANLLGVHVRNHGKDGERTSDMIKRWPRVETYCSDARVVLLLGGCNDRYRPAEISVANLMWLSERARMQLNADVGILTLPPAALDEERLWDVNEHLRSCVEADQTGRLFLCDTAEISSEYLIDTVHLNSEGYAAMASIVAESLVQHLVSNKEFVD